MKHAAWLLVPLAVLGGLFLIVVPACTATFVSFSRHDLSEVAQRTDTIALDLAAGRTLRVETPSGDVAVVIEATSGGGRAEAACRARAATADHARTRLARVSAVLDVRGDVATLSVRDDGAVDDVPSMAIVDFRVAVPAGVRLEVATRSGDVSASGAGGGPAQLDTSFGDVSVSDATGDVDATTRSGDVVVSRTSGGHVRASSTYGDVRLAEAVATQVNLQTSSGHVAVRDVRCETLVIEDGYGDVEFEAVTATGAVSANSKSGHVRARASRAASVTLATSYGDVAVDAVLGALTLTSRSGDVTAKGADGAVVAGTEYGDVEVAGRLDALDAHSASGDVDVVAAPGSSVSAPWTLASRYGDVVLSGPADLAFDLQAATGYGSVDVGYAMEVAAGGLASDRKSVRARVNGGTIGVRAETSSGDVRVRPASAAHGAGGR